jgi:hypothetical protein
VDRVSQILDLAAPLRSLRSAAGLTQAQAQQALRALTLSGVTNPEQRGVKIKLSTLIERARAYGLVIEIRVSRKKS